MTTRFVLLGMLIAVPLSAQRLTLGANVGGSSANADLSTSTGWKSGWSAGANLTYRLTTRVGFRADANLAQNDLAGAPGVPGERRFNKAAFMADGVLQREELPGTKLLPYVLAGVGAVQVHDKGSDSSAESGFGPRVAVCCTSSTGSVTARPRTTGCGRPGWQ